MDKEVEKVVRAIRTRDRRALLWHVMHSDVIQKSDSLRLELWEAFIPAILPADLGPSQELDDITLSQINNDLRRSFHHIKGTLAMEYAVDTNCDKGINEEQFGILREKLSRVLLRIFERSIDVEKGRLHYYQVQT